MFIQEEYRHSGRRYKFVNLQAVGPILGPSESVRGSVSDAVSLIQDQHVQTVGICGHELVEIFEERLDLWGSHGSDFAKCLGK
jgi:hypothetical protein